VKVLWHISDPNSLQAGQYIMEGYRAAFEDLGHEFHLLTRSDDFRKRYADVRPDLFWTYSADQYWNMLDLDFLTRERAAGRVVVFGFVERIADLAPGAPGLGRFPHKIAAMRAGRFADFHHAYAEEWYFADFEVATGQRYWSLPLAANRLVHYPVEADPRMTCDIAFVGQYLPEKRGLFQRLLLPLRKQYDVRIYGRDWTAWDRLLGFIDGRVYWHFGIPLHLRRQALSYELERTLYSSAAISLNFHLDFQAREGADVNERTFRIPACGGFELVDWNRSVRTYFSADEVAMAESVETWNATLERYLGSPAQRERMRAAATAKVIAAHTYHHRVARVLEMVATLSDGRAALAGD
jgi:spore maturation protein CgeB